MVRVPNGNVNIYRICWVGRSVYKSTQQQQKLNFCAKLSLISLKVRISELDIDIL